jgi:ATP-dependent protease HslVU (ClpYQ) peptidase subunit
MKLKDNLLEIAYDSQATEGSMAVNMKQPKVFEIGKIIFGISGDLALINAIKFFEFEQPYEDPEKWAITYLAPKLREIAKSLKHDADKDKLYYSILVFAGNQLFELDDDLSVIQSANGNHAIGSGKSYALGALAAGATAFEALEIAAEKDVYTGGELRRMDLEYFESVDAWCYGPVSDEDREEINRLTPLKKEPPIQHFAPLEDDPRYQELAEKYLAEDDGMEKWNTLIEKENKLRERFKS